MFFADPSPPGGLFPLFVTFFNSKAPLRKVRITFTVTESSEEAQYWVPYYWRDPVLGPL